MNARRFRRHFDDSFDSCDIYFRAWLRSIGEDIPDQEDWESAWRKFDTTRQHRALCKFAHRRWLKRLWRRFKTLQN